MSTESWTVTGDNITDAAIAWVLEEGITLAITQHGFTREDLDTVLISQDDGEHFAVLLVLHGGRCFEMEFDMLPANVTRH